MKTLIVDDDCTTRLFLDGILKEYGPAEFATNGKEAIEIVRKALKSSTPFDLICLDIMMPEVNGITVLNEIRYLEASQRIPLHEGAKIMMITALSDPVTVLGAIKGQCDHFLVKPIDKAILLKELHKMALVV
jgi:two-component system chemotaxis response regulator CheY